MDYDEYLPKEKANLISDMNTQIKKLNETPKNIVEFWQETMDIIKETMIQTAKVRNYAKILRIWSAGINKLEDEFDINNSENVKEIFYKTNEMINDEDLDKSLESIEKLYSYMSELEWRTDEIFSMINKTNHQNPLLALPAIRKAVPLKKEMIYRLKPSDLYLSTIKSIILKDDNIDPIEADKKVCTILKKYNIPKCKALEVMLASPNISHLDFKDKRKFLMEEINLIYSKDKINTQR